MKKKCLPRACILSEASAVWISYKSHCWDMSLCYTKWDSCPTTSQLALLLRGLLLYVYASPSTRGHWGPGRQPHLRYMLFLYLARNSKSSLRMFADFFVFSWSPRISKPCNLFPHFHFLGNGFATVVDKLWYVIVAHVVVIVIVIIVHQPSSKGVMQRI